MLPPSLTGAPLPPVARDAPCVPLPLLLQVACGGRHTLALTQRGVPWSFGCNGHRQLGRSDGHGEGALEPRPVSALSATRVVQVACGGAHTAALVRLPASSSAGGVTDRRASMGGGSPEAGRRSSAADWRTSLERRSSTGATIASMQ